MSPEDPEPAPRWSGRTAGVTAVGISAIAWWPAFTLGAWGVVFFEQLMLLWAAATAAFTVLLLRPSNRPLSPWRAAALLIPTAWLLLTLLAPTGQPGGLADTIRILGVALTLLGIPAMAWLLLRIASPDIVEVSTRRDRWVAGTAVLVVVLLSYLIGLTNDLFLTCGDFTISGNTAPAGCNPGQPTLG